MTRLTVGDPAPLFELPGRRRDARPRWSRPRPRRPSSSSPPTAARTPAPGTTASRPSPATTPTATSTVLQIVSNDDSRPRRGLRSRPCSSAWRRASFAGPLLHDAEQSAAQAYGATATPEVFVIDRAGDRPLPRRPGRRLRRPVAGRRLGARGARRRPRRPRGRPAVHLAGGLLGQVAGGAALVGGLPDPRRGGRAARADPRRHRQGRRPRRPARGAHPRRGAAARLPGLAHVPGRRAGPVPDRRRRRR